MAIAAIAAITFAVVGCAGGASPSGASPGVTPSPSPVTSAVSAAPRPSVEATTPIPDALRYVWLGPARDIPALDGPLAVSIIRFRGSSFDFIFGGQGAEALNSTVSISEAGQVHFSSLNTSAGCAIGDEGTYDWTTTADGAGLTMTKVAEACAPRADAVVGTWVRAACRDFGCLGDLEAGDHVTSFFEPQGDDAPFRGSWRMQYGLVSYTVPDGWANAVDDPNLYVLVPQDEYTEALPDVRQYPGLILLPNVSVAAQDAACSPAIEPGVGP